MSRKKTRYTEEQIAYALRQAELGTPVVEIVRKMGVSEQTFYGWKESVGGKNRKCRTIRDWEATCG